MEKPESRMVIGRTKNEEWKMKIKYYDSVFIKLFRDSATIGPMKIPPNPSSFIPTYIEASVAKEFIKRNSHQGLKFIYN